MPDRLLIIGELGSDVNTCADALAQDFNLSLAATIADACKRLQKETAALILCDVGESGALLAETLRTLRQLSPSTPVIVSSLGGQADLIVDAVKAGAADFLGRSLPKN